MTFKVGDKVRCIDPVSFGHPYHNNIYKVTSIRPAMSRKGLLLGLSTGCGEKVGEWYSSKFVLEQTTKPHKWAKEIIAYAQGSIVQRRHQTRAGAWSDWYENTGPSMSFYDNDFYEYRIKLEKKPDITEFCHMSISVAQGIQCAGQFDNLNLKCIFDGETGKLKAVELL